MGKGLTVTTDIAVKAVLFGACRVPKVGKALSDFSTSELIWAERILPITGLSLSRPLWTFSGDGNGYGYGYGNGNGYGDGYGNGYGYGYGNEKIEKAMQLLKEA